MSTARKPSFSSRLASLACLFATGFVLLAGAAAARADELRRVALVIGNGAYGSVSALKNAPQDAEDIAAALKRLGFEVTLAQDLGAVQMRRQLQAFEDQTIGAHIALVYYAGHGIEVDGVNYLIPVDAVLKRDVHVDDEAIPLTRVIASVEPATQLRLLIIDACRDNPFIARMRSLGTVQRSIGRGLARIEPTGSTLVAYAARDGTTAADGVGDNSPYARALLDAMEEPGLEIGFLLRRVRDQVIKATAGAQEPVTYGALGSEPIYLAQAPPLPGPAQEQQVASTEPTAQPLSGRGADEQRPSETQAAVAYAAAQRIDTVEAWDAFLEYCRYSVYCGLARAARATAASRSTLPAGELKAVPEPAIPVPGAAPARAPEPAEAADRLAHAAPVQTALSEPQDPAALTELALAHQFGRNGNAVDPARAKVAYDRAVEAGSAAALTGLGVLSYSGTGVPRDYEQARRLFEKAAEQGHAGAMNNLGVLYERGEGVLRDESRAREWYERAAQAGNASAKHGLGLLLATGRSAPQDVDRAAALVVEALAAHSAVVVGQLAENARRYDPVILKGAQRFLVEGGHLVGRVDGRIGPASRRALEAFAAAAAAPAPLEALLDLDAGGSGRKAAPVIADEGRSKQDVKPARRSTGKATAKTREKTKPAARSARQSKPKPATQARAKSKPKPQTTARRQTKPKPQSELPRQASRETPASPKPTAQKRVYKLPPSRCLDLWCEGKGF